MNRKVDSLYRDPCDQCDALCCRVYKIENPKQHNFFDIPIKVQHLSCTHLEESRCSVYDSRESMGFSVCGEYSCASVWPMILNWAKNMNLWVQYESKGSFPENDHMAIATCMNQAREYVLNLLGIQSIRNFQPSKKDLEDIHEHVSSILAIIHTNAPLEIQEIWQSYLSPTRWYTEVESAEIVIRRARSLHEAMKKK